MAYIGCVRAPAARASTGSQALKMCKCGVAAVILLSIGFVSSAAAEDIFKCVSGAETAYQSSPCMPGAEQTRMAPTPDRVRTAAPSSSTSRPSARSTGVWKHRALALGMSDDEVLNMSGWGRPDRINRVRLPREWREEWVYGAETLSERHLYFSNGRLLDIGDRGREERMAEADERMADASNR